MVSHMKIEDYFVRKLKNMAITPNYSVPVLSKHLRGYVPDKRQLGSACNNFPIEIDQFTKAKFIHTGKV